MADRMRVTSLIGGTERLEGLSGRSSPTTGAGLGIFDLRGRPTWRATRSLSPATETANEYTSRLAANPRLLRHRHPSPCRCGRDHPAIHGDGQGDDLLRPAERARYERPFHPQVYQPQ